jgi:hypothetical protein
MFMPGMNPRPTLKASFSAACKGRTLEKLNSLAHPKARPLLGINVRAEARTLKKAKMKRLSKRLVISN